MTTRPVGVPAYNEVHDKAFGPARIEHRTADSDLSELGTYFMVFDGGGLSDPWTLQYEETIYVAEGQAHLVAIEPDGDRKIVAGVGDLIVLPKGSTVRYGAAAGSKLVLSISPVNWREISR